MEKSNSQQTFIKHGRTMDILETLAYLRRQDPSPMPYDELLAECSKMGPTRGFAHALSRGGVIAELKKASPSEGLIREDFRPAELAAELESAGACALSVLCEPHRFLGSEEYLRAARKCATLPILYKDFITERRQIAAARYAGADAVLLIAALLNPDRLAELLAFAHSLGLDALVETHDADEIRRAINCGAKIIGVNCRNLRDLTVDTALFADLIAQIPEGAIKVAESGMHSAEAILAARNAGANAFLVGTALMREPSPGEKLRSLVSRI